MDARVHTSACMHIFINAFAYVLCRVHCSCQMWPPPISVQWKVLSCPMVVLPSHCSVSPSPFLAADTVTEDRGTPPSLGSWACSCHGDTELQQRLEKHHVLIVGVLTLFVLLPFSVKRELLVPSPAWKRWGFCVVLLAEHLGIWSQSAEKCSTAIAVSTYSTRLRFTNTLDP